MMIFAVIFGQVLIEWIRYVLWKRNYSNDFKSFLKNKLSNSKNRILFKRESDQDEIIKNLNSYIKDPTLLDSKLWDHFDGKKVPVNSLTIKTWKRFLSFLIFLILDLVIFSLIILSIIKR